MKENWKAFKRIISMAMIAVIVASIIFSESSIKSYAAENEEGDWALYQTNNENYKISVDKKVKYGECPYSIKIENTGYNYVSVIKHFVLKPNTQYRVSAMVKYAGYEPEDEKIETAGHLRAVYLDGTTQFHSNYSHREEWTKIISDFTTDDSGAFNVWLCNGGLCKGTAWFSDFKIEEIEENNNWNILVLIFKNIDAEAVKYVKNEKDEDVEEFFRVKASIPDDEVKSLKDILSTSFKKQLPKLTDGLLNVNDVDIFEIDEAITKLKYVPGNNTLSNQADPETDATIKKQLDKYLEKKSYQQIALVFTYTDVWSWHGLGGYKYNGINCCQVKYFTIEERKTSPITIDNDKNTDYPISTYVHEMMHGLEHESRAINPDITAETHGNVLYYTDSYTDSDGWYEYHHDFLTCNLPDGKGIDPRAFYRKRLVLVSDDLTPDKSIKGAGSVPVHISKVITLDVEPDLHLEDCNMITSKWILSSNGVESGKDYTLDLYPSGKITTRKQLVLKGIGSYYGTLVEEISYKPAVTKAKAKKKTLKWNSVLGAEGYEVYYCKSKGKYKLLKTTSSLSVSLSKLKKGNYKFKVRSFAGEGVDKTYSDWSKAVSLKIK